MRLQKDVNGMDRVFRINAANYLDKEIFFLAFGKDSRKLFDLLSGYVEEAREFERGV